MTASAFMRAKPRMWISFVAHWLVVFANDDDTLDMAKAPFLRRFQNVVTDINLVNPWLLRPPLVAATHPTERRMPKPGSCRSGEAHQNIDLKHQ